jgi:hypothetical protein
LLEDIVKIVTPTKDVMLVVVIPAATVENNSLTHEEIILDPHGCYFFLVHDLFVDGLCCEYGSGSVDLVFDGAAIELSEFDDALDESTGYEHMAHAYIGSDCADVPFLPSALDSSCESACGSTTLRPSGCSCDCVMADTRRSRNGEVAVAFGDCCPDYVAKCTEPASTIAVGTAGKLQVSYTKSNDGTMPSITLFNATGPVETGSCDTPTGCKIAINVNSDGLVCSEMQLRINEKSESWIFAEDVILSVTLDGESILSYEGNIFPSVLSFNCTLFSKRVIHSRRNESPTINSMQTHNSIHNMSGK